jgi:hypothetical protein
MDQGGDQRERGWDPGQWCFSSLEYRPVDIEAGLVAGMVSSMAPGVSATGRRDSREVLKPFP